MLPTLENLAIRANAAAERDLSLRPATGVYYAVRMPARWQLLAFRYDEFPVDIGHPDIWEQHICPYLAAHWARELHADPELVENALKLYCYGFPRGRVSLEGRDYRVSHGDDITKFMGVSRLQVERCFGIAGLAVWKKDEHSLCLKTDVMAIKASFALDEEWPYFNMPQQTK